MSEEMKLLMALCDALGFSVKKQKNYKMQAMTVEQVDSMKMLQAVNTSDRIVEAHEGKWIRTLDGGYITTLKNPITSYRVQKKRVRE